MEITSDLLAISGIFVSLSSKHESLIKIRHKGGNEDKIINILKEVNKFLVDRSYILDKEIKPTCKKKVEDLILFLVLNTELDSPIEVKHFLHLRNSMPQISKCLLANIVVQLHLCCHYTGVIELLPIQYLYELTAELIPCLKKLELRYQTREIFAILKSVAIKIGNVGNKELINPDILDNLVEVSHQILLNFSGIDSEKLENISKNKIYKYMGYAFMSLLDLLLLCDVENTALNGFINELINTAGCVGKCITIHTYCYWVEIDEEDGQSLQSLISGKSYLVIEKYTKFKSASELIQVIQPFAVKPKTVKELIKNADIETMINTINKANADQKKWFQALLTFPVFNNKDAKNCLSAWSHLSSEGDVIRLLDLCSKNPDEEAHKITIKCAASLEIPELILSMSKHFYNNGFVILNLNIQPQLLILFNKLKETTTLNDTVLQELLLLILQNPEFALKYIYGECLKNLFYTSTMKDFFSAFKDVAKVNNIGFNCLFETITGTTLTEQTLECHYQLINTLLEINYLTHDLVIEKLFVNRLQYYFDGGDYENLKFTLKIINAVNFQISPSENMCLYNLILSILKLRVRFMDFDGLKQEIVKEVVHLVLTKHVYYRLEDADKDVSQLLDVNEDDDNFTSFYKTYMKGLVNASAILTYSYNDFNVENKSRAVCCLLQLLPSCVTSEWVSICSEIDRLFGYKELISVLTDFMIILCQLTYKQESTPSHPILITALKYYVQNFGCVCQEVIIPKLSTVEDENILTIMVIDLLCNMPHQLKQENGLTLTSLVSERSLKSLSKDKNFVCKICMIKDAVICNVLAQKMLPGT